MNVGAFKISQAGLYLTLECISGGFPEELPTALINTTFIWWS